MTLEFKFGCGHVKYDETIHEAKWGARLIYSEVTAGGSGVVWDRQTPTGEPELVETLFPVIDRAMTEFRKPEIMYDLPSDDNGHFCWREGRALVVMSPQGSYGYLYITAVLEREDHEGESDVWSFEDQPGRKELGNWPPRVVEAAAEKQRKQDIDRVTWLERDYKWALDEVRYARTDRARTIRQKKADKIGDELLAAREKTGIWAD